MGKIKHEIIKGGVGLPLLFIALSGCAAVETTRVVEPGDRVGLHFTCLQNNGEIAASTLKEINDSALPKSPAFRKRSLGDAVLVEAGSGKKSDSPPEGKQFEDEVLERLALAVVGMREGDAAALELAAERNPGLPPQEQFIKFSRVRKRSKELKLSLEEYKRRSGKEPAVDQPFTIDPVLPGRVAEIAGNEVVIRFAPRPGAEASLPFGRGVIRDKGDRYEIEVDATKGSLVRSGAMVGRVADVDADFITLDYGHPFGGEVLKCDIKVDSVQRGERKEAAAGVGVDKGIERGFNEAMAKAGSESGLVNAADPLSVAAQPGDLVTVDFTASLEDGAIFATTLENAAKDPARKKVAWYSPPPAYAPEEILAGKQELFPGLGEAVTGMASGEKKRVMLSPDKAFGPADPQKLVQFPCSRAIPRVISMTAEEYAKQFSSFPVLNREVELVPYFRSRVKEVSDRDVALEALVTDGQTFTDSFGTVTITVAGDEVTTTLKPLIGAQFPMKEGMGTVTASDGKTFTVDGNHPLAGKTIVLDLEVVKVSKGAALKMKPVDWIEDHEKGLAKAKGEGRPAVLVLYADWCGYCKKLFSETITDPRVGRLRDKFVWVKVNSDREKKYYEQYRQTGFPMIVLFKPDGSVVEKIDGFKDGAALGRILINSF